MNISVNFKIAKLLKEKGYALKTYFQYGLEYDWESKKLIGEPKLQKKELENYNSKSYIKGCSYSAPLIVDVLWWLYTEHHIWISVLPNEPYIDNDWCFIIFKNLKNNLTLEGYNSPTEAKEAAIEYVLENKFL